MTSLCVLASGCYESSTTALFIIKTDIAAKTWLKLNVIKPNVSLHLSWLIADEKGKCLSRPDSLITLSKQAWMKHLRLTLIILTETRSQQQCACVHSKCVCVCMCARYMSLQCMFFLHLYHPNSWLFPSPWNCHVIFLPQSSSFVEQCFGQAHTHTHYRERVGPCEKCVFNKTRSLVYSA